MNRPPEMIETERLRLRPPQLDDAERIFEEYAQDPEVTRYLVWKPHKTVEDTQAFLRRCLMVWETDAAYPWVIERAEDSRLLGMIELRYDEHGLNVGYVLARSYWGCGYMPEAVNAIIRWAFVQPDVYRVWAYCDVENPASRRVMEKVGMTYEGLLRRWGICPCISDVPRDCLCYAIVR